MNRLALRMFAGLGFGLILTAPSLAQKASSILPGGNAKAPVSIDAAKLEYFDKEQKLVYSGNVIAKQGEATLRASTLIIFLNSSATQGAEPAAPATPGTNNNQIKKMEATGPVTIVSKDQVGTGDHGIYEKAENKVYLIGNVTLSQGGNIIKGLKDSKLIYDLTTSQAQIAGGVSSLFAPGSGSGDAGAGKKPDAKTDPKAAPKPRTP